MTLLYYDPRFLDHDTGQHPECADRLRQIVGHLEAESLLEQVQQPTWEPAAWEQIVGTHTARHVETIESLATEGGGRADADTVVSPVSVDVAKLAAGALCDAVERVLKAPLSAGERLGEGNIHRAVQPSPSPSLQGRGTTFKEQQALCLVRPPGHHALAERAMGFCLLNNVAIAANVALEAGLERVLIVDWDVHHGNGTQAIFYDDPRVGFFSVHRWPFYPGTGTAQETGTGAGLTTTCNLPVSISISREEYRSQVLRELEDFATRLRPELVLVSAGFDSHRLDPIGSLGLEVEDFVWLTTAVKEIAASYAAGRLVSTLEGGYNPPILAECVAAHLRELLGN